MKKRMIEIFSVSTVCSVALLLFGCANQPGGAAPAPGRSNLVVSLRAEPKRGWQQPIDDPYAGVINVGQRGAFAEVDYSSLEDIVVWVTQTGQAISPDTPPRAAINLDAAKPTRQLMACGLSDTWTIENSPAADQALYVRSESGKVFNLSAPNPSGQATFSPHEAGLMELMSDSSDRPLARIYVAPVAGDSEKLVRVSRSNTKVTFIDLPPGPVAISTWHERLPGSTVTATLLPGQVTSVISIIGVNSLPKVP